MILQALAELAENEKLTADPDFEFRPVSWIVNLDSNGDFLLVEDNRKNLTQGQTDKRGKPAKPKMVGMNVIVPRFPTGRSGTKPPASFMVDMAKFVFGREPGEAELSPKFRPYVERFRELVVDCEAATADPSVIALRKFLDDILAGAATQLPPYAGPSDLFMFRVGDDEIPLQSRPAVRAYWKQRRAMPIASSDESDQRFCLVTGQPVDGESALFPLIKRVPGGGTMGVGLVSFNARAWESYGWEKNDNAVISRDAAEAAAAALNRLLDPRPTDGAGTALPVRHIRLSDDTIVVFWSPAAAPEVQDVLDSLPDLLNPQDDATDVGNLLTSLQKGVFRPLETPGRFYAMTLTGVQGRVIVRDWLEASVAEVQRNLQAHFTALECVRNTPAVKGRPPRAVLTLGELMVSLAAPGRDSKVPAVLAADFIHAALRGTPYPSSILQRALLRERAEVTSEEWSHYIRQDARAALIKAVLTRDPKLHIELEENMDESRTDPGYWLGALLAILEDTQRLASGGVNASIKDKFYGAASATPAAVFPTMMDLFHKHARKAHDLKPGATVFREKRVDEILHKLNSIPVHLDLPQQALFVLGYHHQRYELFRKPSEQTVETKLAQEGAKS